MPRIHLTPHAEDDLNYLKRRHKNIRQSVRNTVLPALAQDPSQGEALEGEFAGVLVKHFSRDRYRLAYYVDDATPDDPVLVVLGVGLKAGFYETLSERMGYLHEEEP